jgi:HD-like signal output (HDOD) protein
MKRVLFVDDEPRVLEGLRRMLRGLRQQWGMEFVPSGEEALQRLKVCPFDVIVSDMRMPGMDGAQLLEHVRQQSPATVRIVLSGHSDRDAVRKTAGVAHQFLAKPCDSEAIATTVTRACHLQDRLGDPWYRALVSRVASVASSRKAHAQLVAELESAEPSVERIGEVISRDVGTTAKLLQLVSSSFSGSSRAGSDPAHWTASLGIDTIRPLVLKDQAAHVLEADCTSDWIETLTAHSLQVAQCARRLTESETTDATEMERAYLAGLLHDIGLFILAEHLPERFAEVWTAARSAKTSVWEIERAGSGVTHADIGGYLLALWGAPDAVVEAAAVHHEPSLSPATTFGVLTAVHVADALAEAADRGVPVEPGRIDMEHLKRIGRTQRLPRWCELCRAVAPEEVRS